MQITFKKTLKEILMSALTYLLLYFLSPDLGDLPHGLVEHAANLLVRLSIWLFLRRIRRLLTYKAYW